MKLYPVANGKHNNVHFIAKVPDLFTMKIMGNYENEKAYVLVCSLASKKQKFVDFINRKYVFDLLTAELLNKGFKLTTPIEDIFINRGGEKLKKYKESLYN